MSLFFGFLAFAVSRFIDFLLSIENGELPSAWVIFSAIFLAPYIETFIFQKCGFFLFEKFRLHYFIKISLISASFSFFHFDRSFSEKVELFFVGLIFTAIYFCYKNNSKINSFKITANTHLIYNLITIVYIYLGQPR